MITTVLRLEIRRLFATILVCVAFSAQTTSAFVQTDVDRAEHSVDQAGVPYLDIVGVGQVRHPAWIALYALAYAGVEQYDSRLSLETNEEHFWATINWLEENLVLNESGLWIWTYAFDNTYNDISIDAPWGSAFAQATGLQALLVAHEKSGDARYLELAERAGMSLTVPLAKGGFLFSQNADIWFEEIPSPAANPGHILNGHMRAVLALHELSQFSSNDNFAAWFNRGKDTLLKWLPRFDAGHWLRYDLNPKKNDILFRLADPYGFPASSVAIDRISLNDPTNGNSSVIDVGVEGDFDGLNRIAGVHWGVPEVVEGRTVRRIVPLEFESIGVESDGPHTYFYMSLPSEWSDNLRNHSFELEITYLDEAAGQLTVQQRSIAPTEGYRDLRDGDLMLTGAGVWRDWMVPLRTTDLGHWVGIIYAQKHSEYLERLSEIDSQFEVWSIKAREYFNFVAPSLQDAEESSSDLSDVPPQTTPLPFYGLDERGVVYQKISDDDTKFLDDGSIDISGSLNVSDSIGLRIYNPWVIAAQLRFGGNYFKDVLHIDEASGNIRAFDYERVERAPALNWLLDDRNYYRVGGGVFYRYEFDNVYNDIYSPRGWVSSFAQAGVLESLMSDFEGAGSASIKELAWSVARSFEVPVDLGGVLAVTLNGNSWFEEVPNRTHVLNAQIYSINQLFAVRDFLETIELDNTIMSAWRALTFRTSDFDTGYWLRYDQNPKKEILIQLDWLSGTDSPEIDEIVLYNPASEVYTLIDVGADDDALGDSRITGLDWQQSMTWDGRSVRAFRNGYLSHDEPVVGGTRHNVYFLMRVPESPDLDFFEFPDYKLLLRYRDRAAGKFLVNIQAINQGDRLAFVPLRSGVFETDGSGDWKEVRFTIRANDLGWYKGKDYQIFEVEQLERVAELLGDRLLRQYAERHRFFLDEALVGRAPVMFWPDRNRKLLGEPLGLVVLAAGKTYDGFGFENSIDRDVNDDYTAGVEHSPAFVDLEIDGKSLIDSVRFSWENGSNRARHVTLQVLDQNGRVGSVLFNGALSGAAVEVIDIVGAEPVQRVRIIFDDFVGQPRVLLRQIEVFGALVEESKR